MRDSIRILLSVVALALGACRADPAVDAPVAAGESPPSPAAAAPAVTSPGETWNATQIDWQPYEAGLARAKAQHKPICLIFFTSWCQHCKAYSKIFDDPTVVEKARNFVMIRVNADDEGDLAHRFVKDGGYIPRTFFLASDGTPDFDIRAPRDKFVYFYDERNPAAILAGMALASGKLRN
jgi:thiol:disulfide interchange protein